MGGISVQKPSGIKIGSTPVKSGNNQGQILFENSVVNENVDVKISDYGYGYGIGVGVSPTTSFDTKTPIGSAMRFGSSSPYGGYITVYDHYSSASRGYLGYGSACLTGAGLSDFCMASNGWLRFGTTDTIRLTIDEWGAIGLGITDPGAFADIAGSIEARSSVRIRPGVAPVSPNDGDLWYDGTDLKFQQGLVTKTVFLV